MSNLYYDPEDFGLTQVFLIDFSDGCYQFDYLAVWKDREDRLFYAEDSGCSCPSPFERMGLPDLTQVRDASEIVSRMEQRLSEQDDYYWEENERVAREIAMFKNRVGLGRLND